MNYTDYTDVMFLNILYPYLHLGVATIYGHRVTDIDEILDIRKVIGVCQQSDIHFEDLTVEENLSVFASLKGISTMDKEQEVLISYHLECHYCGVL